MTRQKKIFSPVPVTGTPWHLPSEIFERGVETAPIFQEMFDNCAKDISWLVKVLSSVEKPDLFIKKAIDICIKVYLNHGQDHDLDHDHYDDDLKSCKVFEKSLRGYISRDDFMLEEDGQWKQVEFNPISVAGLIIGPRTTLFHKSIYETRRNLMLNNQMGSSSRSINESEWFPENDADKKAYQSICRMLSVYTETFALNPTSTKKWPLIILEIGNSKEANLTDSIFMYATSQNLPIVYLTQEKLMDMLEAKKLYTKPSSSSNWGRDTETVSLQKQMGQVLFLNVNEDDLYGYRPYTRTEEGDRQHDRAVVNSEEQSYPIEYEVAVVYYRHEYQSSHWSDQRAFDARLMVESSRAISVPSVPAILAGCKKIQQLWLDPEILKKYCPSDIMSDIMSATDNGAIMSATDNGAIMSATSGSANSRATSSDTIESPPSSIKSIVEKSFVFMADTDSLIKTEEGQSILLDAIKEPEKYILKPLREGGSGNFHGDVLKEFLTDLIKTKQQKESCILMKRINAIIRPGILLLKSLDDFQEHDVISEVGFFTAAIFNGERKIANDYIGYLVRTKDTKEREGGLVVRASAADSIILYDNKKHPTVFT